MASGWPATILLPQRSFLPVLFLVIALASYQFGQVGARQVPYAYYLLGLTTLTVAADGVTDSAQAWQIGLDRSEEILVGLMSSLLINISKHWERDRGTKVLKI